MGEVFRARDPRINREVAIKLLSPAWSGDGDRLRRFEQEARAAGSINHPNLVTDIVTRQERRFAFPVRPAVLARWTDPFWSDGKSAAWVEQLNEADVWLMTMQ